MTKKILKSAVIGLGFLALIVIAKKKAWIGGKSATRKDKESIGSIPSAFAKESLLVRVNEKLKSNGLPLFTKENWKSAWAELGDDEELNKAAVQYYGFFLSKDQNSERSREYYDGIKKIVPNNKAIYILEKNKVEKLW